MDIAGRHAIEQLLRISDQFALCDRTVLSRYTRCQTGQDYDNGTHHDLHSCLRDSLLIKSSAG